MRGFACYTGMVERVIICNILESFMYSEVYGVYRYRESSLHATLSLTLTPCKVNAGRTRISWGLAYLSHRRGVLISIMHFDKNKTILNEKEIYCAPFTILNISKWLPYLMSNYEFIMRTLFQEMHFTPKYT